MKDDDKEENVYQESEEERNENDGDGEKDKEEDKPLWCFLFVWWCNAGHSVSLTHWRVREHRYAQNDRVMPQQKSIGVRRQQIGAVEHQMPALIRAMRH